MTSNTPNSGAEREPARGNPEDIKTRFYREFVDTKIDGGKRKDIKLLNHIHSATELDADMKKELMKFAGGSEKFDGKIEVENLNISELQSHIRGTFFKMESQRAEVKTLLQSNYEISDEDYKKKLQPEVKTMTHKELADVLKSERFRTKLLHTSFGKSNTPKTRNIINFLEKFNLQKRITDKIDSLPVDKAEKFKEYLVYLLDLNPDNANFSDNLDFLMRGLFEYDIFSKVEKKEILATFMPYVTLRQAVRLDMVKDAHKYKKSLIKKHVVGKKLSSAQLDAAATAINNSEIQVSSKGLKPDDLLEDIGFSNIGDQITDFYSDIKQIESEEGAQTLEGYQKELKEIPSVSGSEHFKKGNIIAVEMLKDKSIESQTVYYKIANDGGSLDKAFAGRVMLESRGDNGVYLPEGQGVFKNTYKGLTDFIKNGRKDTDTGDSYGIKSFKIFDSDVFDQKIKNGEVPEGEDLSDFKSAQDVQNTEMNIRKDFIKKGQDNGSISKDATDAEIDQILSQNSEYQEQLDGLEYYNYDYIKTKLDTFDADGKKHGFEVGTTFATKNAKKGEIYTIIGLDKENTLPGSMYPGFVTLVGINGNEEKVDFYNFYENFKSKQTKRTGKINSIDDVLFSSQESVASWNGFEIKNGEIKNKDEAASEFDYEYLVSNDGDKFLGDYDLIKIHNISGNNVEVSFGSYDDDPKEKKDELKKKKFKVAKEKFTVTTGMLASWIANAQMNPKSLKQENSQETDDIDTVERKGSFSSRFFDRKSIAELIAGGKVWLDSIEAYLKEGNEEHAAEFASSLWLPEELRNDLNQRVEAAGRKRMDQYIEQLEQVDSKPATETIERWLLNKDSSEPKKEAALIFMSKKYGTLYTKSALYQHKGKFLWYEALGGRVNDDLYKEEKKKARDSDTQFTEESLVYSLINRQCKKRLKPHRRSRLYKELEALMGKGKGEEWEKGTGDANKKRMIGDRVEFAIDELKGGSYPNAMGAMEAIVNKGDGGNITTLNHVPFVMLFSGVAHSFDQDMCDKFKNMPNNGQTIMSVAFTSNTSKINLYNETVLKISEDMSKTLGGKYSGMHAQARKIFDQSQSSSVKEEDKIINANKFFEEYGEALTRSMNFLNTGKTDELGQFEKWIYMRKDEPGNSVYKKYFELFTALTGEADFSKSDDLNADAFNGDGGEGGLTGINMYKAVLQTFKPVSGGTGFRMEKSGPMFWREIQRQFDATLETDFVNPNDKRERIRHDVQGLFAGLSEIYGNSQGGISKVIETSTGAFYKTFKKWGVQAKDFEGVSYDDILDDKSDRGVALVNKYTDNILNGVGNSTGGINGPASLISDVSNAATRTLEDKATSQNTINDVDYQSQIGELDEEA